MVTSCSLYVQEANGGPGAKWVAVYGSATVNCRNFSAAKNFRLVCVVSSGQGRIVGSGWQLVASARSGPVRTIQNFAAFWSRLGHVFPFFQGSRHETHRIPRGVGLLSVGIPLSNNSEFRPGRPRRDQSAASGSAAAADSASAFAAANVLQDQGARLPRQNH